MGEAAKIEILDDGRAVIYTGTSPHGQGHDTSWSMIASDQTGIPIDRIELVWGDTDLVPVGGGTMGSRSLQQGGAAVDKAAVELVEQGQEARRHVAGGGRVRHRPRPRRRRLPRRRHAGRLQVVGRSGRRWPPSDGEPLLIETRFEAGSPTFPFGAHVAVVEVDVETGQVRHVRHVACDDAGRVINPLILEGQIHGGVAQGAAQALLEEVRYDADGNPVTSNLADYGMISAAELPSFEIVHMETPTPVNPLGAKGIGESGTIGSTPAVQSAVVDAVSHLGVRHIDMPATAERGLAGHPGRSLTASVLRNRPDRAGSDGQNGGTGGGRWVAGDRRLAEPRAIVTPMLSYLDPGTGSMIAAAFAGGIAGFGVLLRMYGHRVLGVFSKKHRTKAEEAQAELVGSDADS